MQLSNFLYISINLGTFFAPFIIALLNRQKVWVSLRRYAVSMGLVSVIFLIWDAIATHFGHWGFSKGYTLGAKFFGLPLEEILFFVTTSYACLFIFEAVEYFTRDSLEDSSLLQSKYRLAWGMGASAAVFLAIVSWPRYYSVTIFVVTALVLLLLTATKQQLFFRRNFWLGLLIVYVPFFIINSILTAPPVVWYSDAAILGIRVGTIPIEDFFYNFSLIVLYKGLYDRVK